MAKNKALELSIRIAGSVDKSLYTTIAQTNSALGDLTTSLSRIGTAGLAAMAAAGAATATVLSKCTNEAEKLESAMAPVVRYVDGLADATGKIDTTKYAQMKEYIQDLSTQIPRTTDQIATMSAALGQSGKGYTEQLTTGILKDTAVAATAMDLDDDTAAQYMAKWEEAFNFSHTEVMTLMDQINYLGANYATTAAEIASSVNSAGSIGQIAGVTPEDTAAIATAMQAMGVSSDKVGTTITRIYTNISKGTSATAAQKAMWQELGMAAEGVAKSMQIDGNGTLVSIFEAIGDLPEERQVAALNTLFGQWAIQGGAKVAQNVELLKSTLASVSDPSLYTGSMEREYNIQAATTENIGAMTENAKTALMQTVGEAFLPAKKQWLQTLSSLYDGLRKNTPALTELGETLAETLSKGVTALSEALEKALPYVQSGLSYLNENGAQVADTLKKLALTFGAMKLAPAAGSILSGASSLALGTQKPGSGSARAGGLVGTVKSLMGFGTGAAATATNAGGLLSAVFGTAKQNGGLGRTASVALSSLLAGNGLSGTASLLTSGNTSLLSGFSGIGESLVGKVKDSAIGSYVQSVGSSLSGLGSALLNTKVGQKLTTTAGNVTASLWNVAAPLRQGLATAGATANIWGGVLQQGLQDKLGKVTGVIGTVKNSAAGQAISGALGSLGSVASAGGGVLSSVWGPIASGFGSIFASAAPAIGVISAIIAVVSILGDNLDGIRGIVENVFGETGLAIFDGFVEKISGVGELITGLFQDGGVANALSGLRETIGGIFGENALPAFDGVVDILQSIMGAVGQVVSFATGTVKPIIVEIFSFVTGTVIPILVQTFATAAPHIAGIISGLGSGIMTVMEFIGSAIQTILPVVEGIVTVLLGAAGTVVPALLAWFSTMLSGITPILEAIKTVLGGLITFITGVFTLNWSQAWEGVKTVFGGIFDGLAVLIKTPINAVISLINTAIEGINSLGITIPDWVPLLGGKSLSFDFAPIPMLGKGGFTNGVSIAGEAGTEAVISFQSGVRAQNIATWAKAGQMLGVGSTSALKAFGDTREVKTIPNEGEGRGGGNITFAPQITIQGNADRSVVEEALREAEARFERWYAEHMRREARTRY